LLQSLEVHLVFDYIIPKIREICRRNGMRVIPVLTKHDAIYTVDDSSCVEVVEGAMQEVKRELDIPLDWR
jgi:hypothetical protein